MPVVSVDLAYKNYRDIGVAILERQGSAVQCTFEELAGPSTPRPPSPSEVAVLCVRLCSGHGARLLLLDGPQGWKDPDNGLEHSRVCERLLNTPAKTGLPGCVKPKTYGSFVQFSVAVFDELQERGMSRFGVRPASVGSYPTAIESFPFAAWRALGIPPLPAKSKTTPADLKTRFRALCETHQVTGNGQPNHDQLQALVAGLGGLAMEERRQDAFAMVGAAPAVRDGSWREGYIIIPTRTLSALTTHRT